MKPGVTEEHGGALQLAPRSSSVVGSGGRGGTRSVWFALAVRPPDPPEAGPARGGAGRPYRRCRSVTAPHEGART